MPHSEFIMCLLGYQCTVSIRCKILHILYFALDDIDMKSKTLPSGTSRHINPASDVPMDTDVECTDEEKLCDRLVKFVKDKLHTGTLSLAEMKRLLLLHPVGKCDG